MAEDEKLKQELAKNESDDNLETKEEIDNVKENAVVDEEKEDLKEESKDVKVSSKVDVDNWNPKTEIGKKVKSGEIKDIDEILDNAYNIFETEITDILIPSLESDLLLIGQAKGKFGGGQKRVFRQTQKKTPEGNNPSFCCIAVVGDKNGHVGVGRGKSKDTVPAREKALRKAKENLIKIRRGCGSWQCGCKTPHSIPFAVEGSCGSVKIRLMPAPKGKGLVIEPECAKILAMAGIKDVWSETFGQTKVKINLVDACIDALNKLNRIKILPGMADNVGMIEGSVKKND
ncbi:30S ribosomal protein S5 [Candidatus Woesearchaeota archaeon]|nr:30S ribosomal protein S5 [Candidatus Woesearchaeota archaeon]MBW2978874.1 30S ribosomal protein S5 [Candidatus Woesearchaeota archaeon]